MADTLLMGRR